jgi:hypothetical protein
VHRLQRRVVHCVESCVGALVAETLSTVGYCRTTCSADIAEWLHPTAATTAGRGDNNIHDTPHMALSTLDTHCLDSGLACAATGITVNNTQFLGHLAQHDVFIGAVHLACSYFTESCSTVSTSGY